MLLKSTIPLLLATLAAAVPSKRQPELIIRLWLTNTVVPASEEVTAPVNGTAVTVKTLFPINRATVKCLEACDQLGDFHCLFLIEDSSIAITLLEGNTVIDQTPHDGSIVCVPGLPDPGLAATGARVTEPNDGASSSTDNEAD